MSKSSSVSRHIDESTKSFECLVLFMVPMFIIRPFFPRIGILLTIFLPLLYLKLTLGKPDGVLFHLAYRFGLPIPGLLPRKIRQLRR